jgi:hypothetical protein
MEGADVPGASDGHDSTVFSSFENAEQFKSLQRDLLSHDIFSHPVDQEDREEFATLAKLQLMASEAHQGISTFAERPDSCSSTTNNHTTSILTWIPSFRRLLPSCVTSLHIPTMLMDKPYLMSA